MDQKEADALIEALKIKAYSDLVSLFNPRSAAHILVKVLKIVGIPKSIGMDGAKDILFKYYLSDIKNAAFSKLCEDAGMILTHTKDRRKAERRK